MDEVSTPLDWVLGIFLDRLKVKGLTIPLHRNKTVDKRRHDTEWVGGTVEIDSLMKDMQAGEPKE